MARNIKFVVDGYYHIYNRGVDKRKIFLDSQDLYYFLDNLIIFNIKERTSISTSDSNLRKLAKQIAKQSKPLVKIVAYALLPNHFHLILKEIGEGGISKFMQKISTSYTMYFNEKYDRSGALFQGTFKAKPINDLIVLSSYVNLNFIHHGYSTESDLVKTSFFEYVDAKTVSEPICDKNEVDEIVKASNGAAQYKKDAKRISEYFVDTHKHDKTFNL